MGLLRGDERGEIYQDRTKYLLEPNGKYDFGKKFLKKSFAPDYFLKNWVFRQARYFPWKSKGLKSGDNIFISGKIDLILRVT
jgi:hypothetical protein